MVSWVSPGRCIFLGDVVDMPADIDADRRSASFRIASSCAVRSASKASSGNLASITMPADRTGQTDEAVGPLAVRERRLEAVGVARQGVLDDGFHAQLAEGAALLLVGQDVLQRDDARRKLGDVALGACRSRRDAHCSLRQIFRGLARGLLQIDAEIAGSTRSSRSWMARPSSAWLIPATSAMACSRPFSAGDFHFERARLRFAQFRPLARRAAAIRQTMTTRASSTTRQATPNDRDSTRSGSMAMPLTCHACYVIISARLSLAPATLW